MSIQKQGGYQNLSADISTGCCSSSYSDVTSTVLTSITALGMLKSLLSSVLSTLSDISVLKVVKSIPIAKESSGENEEIFKFKNRNYVVKSLCLVETTI